MLFLMHRVELKATNNFSSCSTVSIVPNAPCGVESPCGGYNSPSPPSFLMHRVELKGDFAIEIDNGVYVPNAPCGVERSQRFSHSGKDPSFLMHRVDLKGNFPEKYIKIALKFLMHRVELKGGDAERWSCVRI